MKSFTEGTFTRDADGRLRFHFRGSVGRDDGDDACAETGDSTSVAEPPPVHFMSDEEAHDLFEREVRRYLGISAEEFLSRWDAGEWPDPDSVEHVMGLVMLIPLVRPHVEAE
jgi:hypothetical protein